MMPQSHWHPCPRCKSPRVRFFAQSNGTFKVFMVMAFLAGIGLGIYWLEPRSEIARLAYHPGLLDYLISIAMALVPCLAVGALLGAVFSRSQRGMNGFCVDCRFGWIIPSGHTSHPQPVPPPHSPYNFPPPPNQRR